MKYYRILILMLALCLCLCACGSGGGEESTSTAPPETTLPNETTEPADEYSLYYDLLSNTTGDRLRYNWLGSAMNCVFSSPQELDLKYYFYNGLDEDCGWNDLSDDLTQRLVDFGFSTEYGDLFVLRRAAMEDVLNEVFGISLDVLSIPECWYYDEATDTYFAHHGDSLAILDFTVTEVVEEGDLIRIYYTSDESTFMNGECITAENMCITLRPVSGGYQVVSNVKL